jgi:hypothetical protein
LPVERTIVNSDLEHITVWTVQPADFDLSQPGLAYDHTQGAYWKNGAGCPRVCRRYREVLPIVHEHYGVRQILWCWSSLVGWWGSSALDTVAWEINLPTRAVLAHFDTDRWAQTVAQEEGVPFSVLDFSLPKEYPIERRCEVLVRWPLTSKCRITKLGPLMRDGPIDEFYVQQLRSGARRG